MRLADNSGDAHELAHDAFVEAYLHLDQLRDVERFAGWLRTLTLNHCRAYLRTASSGSGVAGGSD